SAHENFTRWRFLHIVRRQPRGLWSDKIIEVSPRSSRDRAQESAIIRRQRSAAPAFRRPIDHHHRHRKESPQEEERGCGYYRRGSPRRRSDEKKHASSGDPKPAKNKLPLPTSRAPVSVCRRLPFEEQPMRRQSPVDDANNRIERHCRIIRQKNNREHDAQETVAWVAPKSRPRRRRMEQ